MGNNYNEKQVKRERNTRYDNERMRKETASLQMATTVLHITRGFTIVRYMLAAQTTHENISADV